MCTEEAKTSSEPCRQAQSQRRAFSDSCVAETVCTIWRGRREPRVAPEHLKCNEFEERCALSVKDTLHSGDFGATIGKNVKYLISNVILTLC